jgi:hypothetical protein
LAGPFLYISPVTFTTPPPVSIASITNDGTLKVYPNPVIDVLNLTSSHEIGLVTLYNLTGQMVKLENVNTSTAQINFAGLPKGLYILKVQSSFEVSTYKVILK